MSANGGFVPQTKTYDPKLVKIKRSYPKDLGNEFKVPIQPKKSRSRSIENKVNKTTVKNKIVLVLALFSQVFYHHIIPQIIIKISLTMP
jgi:hypothetical protein